MQIRCRIAPAWIQPLVVPQVNMTIIQPRTRDTTVQDSFVLVRSVLSILICRFKYTNYFTVHY